MLCTIAEKINLTGRKIDYRPRYEYAYQSIKEPFHLTKDLLKNLNIGEIEQKILK